MIDVKTVELDPNNLAVNITLRNGFTYLMVLIEKQTSQFVNSVGFQKFLREQTIKTKNFTTVKQTMIVEKEQVNMIPQLYNMLEEKEESPSKYSSVSLYKTDQRRHPSPSEAPKVTIPYIYYGMDLYDPLTRERVAYVSNLFYFQGYRYFLCELQKNVNSVVANEHGFPVGIIIKYNSINVCLSCRQLLDSNQDYMQQIPTDDITKHYLMRTVYIECHGFTGSGIIKEARIVMTAKHIIPEDHRKVGSTVNVGVYPYNKLVGGTITYIDPHKDHLEITMQIDRNSALLQPFKKDSDYQLTKDIVAIGFGKFNFSLSNFKNGMMLPTLQKGVISKVIRDQDTNVFVKTDALLYNGFSGCGVWAEEGLVAMAVFIIAHGKKKMAWHNYSYTADFLETDGQKHKEFLKEFDEVFTRKNLPIYPKL